MNSNWLTTSPVTVSDPQETNFVDATTGGSKADLKLTFTDWRDHNFDNAEQTKGFNYYKYYGVSAIKRATDASILTNLNGANWAPLSSITEKVDFTFNEPSVTDIQDDRKFGTLVYQNNGLTLGEFDIRVPFDVYYDWGIIRIWVECHIGQTEAN